MKIAKIIAIIGIAIPFAAANAQDKTSESEFHSKPSPKEAFAYIIWPRDGAVYHSTKIKVLFGTRNFGVAPAGTNVADTGHYHLLIDTPLPPLDEPIPNDKNHVHYGKGQTEADVELTPGKHTLQLLMADGDHVAHNPPVKSKVITITVVH